MNTWILVLMMVPALAQAQPGGKKDEHFAEHKTSIQNRVAEEKAAIDQFSSCVGSAQNEDDLRKCHVVREAAMKKMQEEQREERRKHLQDELKKLDSEGQKH